MLKESWTVKVFLMPWQTLGSILWCPSKRKTSDGTAVLGFSKVPFSCIAYSPTAQFMENRVSEFRLRIEVLLRRCGTNSLKQEKPYRYKLASCLTHLNHPHQNALLENFHTCLLRQLSLSLCTKPQRSMWILPGVQLIPEPKIPYEPHSPHLFYSILILSSVFLLRILPCSVSPPFWPDTYDRLCLSVCLSLCMS